jgi:putative peptidoglycan lipid II flippase
MLLWAILARKDYFRITGRVAGRIARIALAAIMMGAALWFAMPYGNDWYSGGVIERVGSILALVAIGSAAYFLLAALMGVIDRDTITRMTKRQG